MIRLEAASFARDPARPQANEDALVVLPRRAYAVIDGVSDRIGTRYDGELSGQHAARLVALALERLLAGAPPPPESIVPTLTATLREAYLRHGTLAAAERDWGARLCCTLALALFEGTLLHLVLVGDSGIRINGREVLQSSKDLDHITATLRSQAWHRAACTDPVARDAAARQVTWGGVEQDPAALGPHGFTPADIAAIAVAAEAECVAALTHVPRADILHLIRHGIVGAQGDYQNNPESVLGYSCLDGFAVPRTLMRITTVEVRTVETLELFTDGYPLAPEGFGLEAWEAAHRRVEAEDPAKVGRFRSTKGSVPGRWTDDRSYVGVRLRQG